MADPKMLAYIEKQIVFQNKWRCIMSLAYFTTAALGLLCSGAATLVSAIGYARYGAILAGAATALFGIESTLFLRQKWTHHRTFASHLEGLKVLHEFGNLSNDETSRKLAQILEQYAVQLPVGSGGTPEQPEHPRPPHK